MMCISKAHLAVPPFAMVRSLQQKDLAPGPREPAYLLLYRAVKRASHLVRHLVFLASLVSSFLFFIFGAILESHMVPRQRP